MKKAIFLPIISLCAFLALFTVVSCDKTKIVEEDLNGFDQQTTVQEQHNLIMERIRNAPDPRAEIRKINEEHGRYVDDDGNVYLDKEDFETIEQARNNPDARAVTIYNSWYNPSFDAPVGVWYWDNGYHYFATLQSAEAFLTCPSGWTLCNEYNQFMVQIGGLYGGCPNPPDCCRTVRGRYWRNSTLIEEDRFVGDINTPSQSDWWEARIRNSDYSGPCCFSTRSYVVNGAGCGFGYGGCVAGNCPGPGCGWFEN